MASLESKKIIQTLIGLESIGTDRQRPYLKILVPICVSILLLLCWLSMSISLGLFSKENGDFSKFSISICGVFGVSIVLAIYWHLLINHERIIALLDDMRGIANDNSFESVAREMLYEKMRRRVRHAVELTINIVKVLPIIFSMPFVYVAYHICFGIYNAESSWIFFFEYWTPFELNTTIRCGMVAVILQFMTAIFTCLILGIFFSVLVECILHVESFIANIKLLFNEIDRMASVRESESSMLVLCRMAVELHNRVYGCLDQLEPLLNPVYSVFVPLISLMISLLLFTIEKYMYGASLVDLQFPIYAVACASLELCILFYAGQKLHSDVADLANQIYASQWHRYPRSVRRFVLLMMMRSQKPFYLTSCRCIYINLETFVDVVNRIYSAFMLFRSVS